MTTETTDHPTYRVRNRKTGQWINLPAPGDGLQPRAGRTSADVKFVKLYSPEQFHEFAKSYIGRHDELPPLQRWRANYGGNACLHAPNRPVPTDKTTPSVSDLAIIQVEDLL